MPPRMSLIMKDGKPLVIAWFRLKVFPKDTGTSAHIVPESFSKFGQCLPD